MRACARLECAAGAALSQQGEVATSVPPPDHPGSPEGTGQHEHLFRHLGPTSQSAAAAAAHSTNASAQQRCLPLQGWQDEATRKREWGWGRLGESASQGRLCLTRGMAPQGQVVKNATSRLRKITFPEAQLVPYSPPRDHVGLASPDQESAPDFAPACLRAAFVNGRFRCGAACPKGISLSGLPDRRPSQSSIFAPPVHRFQRMHPPVHCPALISRRRFHPRRSRMTRCILASSVVALLGHLPARAASIFWDGSGTDWNLVGDWSTVATGLLPDPSAVPGASDIAIFDASSATVAQTVNLNSSQSVLGLATNSSNLFRPRCSAAAATRS